MNQENEYPLIKEIVIENPDSHYDVPYKKPKYDKNGKLITHTRYYITGNLFYADAGSIFTVRKIVYHYKGFLYQYLKRLPELEKMRLEFEYHKQTHIDLDNKASFWVKIFLDVLKKPTDRQILRASKEKNPKPIITSNTIDDDNTKCVDEIKLKFVQGEHKMIFRIYGRVKDEQKKLDLFFVN